MTELFDPSPRSIPAVPPSPEHRELALALPPELRLGTMSWSYPGWIGILYGVRVAPKQLSEVGLTAYSKHPLLRAVEIDRGYYEPLPEGVLRAYAAQVPEDFRFLVKGCEDCTVDRFPPHARYGKRGGELNARYLDAAYAEGEVIAPVVAALGPKLGVLLFQFSPDAGEPRRFVDRLHAFLGRLPKGVPYAVEVRNADRLTPEYAEALRDTGVVHCHNAWTTMPSVLAQAKLLPPESRRPLVVRWLLPGGLPYAEAHKRVAPFDKLVDDDVERRDAIAGLVVRALRHSVPTFVFVDNKAEGCAPLSVARLAKTIAQNLAAHPPRR
jgi:uncharacterized protein YecE (DUF72 family)